MSAGKAGGQVGGGDSEKVGNAPGGDEDGIAKRQQKYICGNLHFGLDFANGLELICPFAGQVSLAWTYLVFPQILKPGQRDGKVDVSMGEN
jgi:hypothetical protein